MILTVMAGTAQFERSRIRERQVEGIAAAKLAGKYRGRKPKLTLAAVQALQAQGLKPAQIAKELHCARQSVYRVLETVAPEGGTATLA